MIDSKMYDENFYRAQKDGSYRSAELTIPKLFNYMPKPRTVVDVGCGLGTWLAVFKQHGAEVAGVDETTKINFLDWEVSDVDITDADMAKEMTEYTKNNVLL